MKKIVKNQWIINALLVILALSSFRIANIQTVVAQESNSTILKVKLTHGNVINGAVNISVNNIGVASNIDVKNDNQEISFRIPATINLTAEVRVCATILPSNAQICKNVQNIQLGQDNKITLDLSQAQAA
jgi:short-subunit dehydrogenase involved in D-alanine esterification of teichoic acids